MQRTSPAGPGREADEISALEGVEVLADEIYSVCASSFTSIAVSLPHSQ